MALDLTRGREGKVVEHFERLRELVGRDAVLEEVYDLRKGEGCTGSGDHTQAVALAETRIGHTNDGGVQDLGMCVQHLLDFARKELLPTTVDDLLQTSHDAHVASGIALAEVTGPKPAVGGEEFGIGGGILVVAQMHRGPGSRDLTLCSWRDLASVLVKETQAHARRCSADSARHRLGIIRQAREGVKAG